MMRMETGKNRKKTGSKPEENRNKTGRKPEINRKKTGSIFSGKGGENVLKMGDAGKKRTGGQASEPRANEKKNRAAFAAGPANPAANTARSSAETSGFSAKTARFRTSGAFGVFGTFGAKCGAAVVALALAFFTALSLVTPALAVSGTLSTEGDLRYLSVSGDNCWTVNGTTITGIVQGKSGRNKYNNSTLTIKNTSAQKGTLFFTYAPYPAEAVDGLFGVKGAVGVVKVDGTERTAAGTINGRNLEAGESITVYIKSGTSTSQNTGRETKVTISGISFELERSDTEVTVNVPDRGGTVKVDGTALTAMQKQNRAQGSTVQLTAEADSGYDFDGWYSVRNSQYSLISSDAECTYTVPKNSVEIQAVFVKADVSAMFSVDGKGYRDFSVAMGYSASTGKPAVLMRDYTLPAGEYTIPAVATLLLPYADGQTAINGQSETLSFANATTVTGSITNAMLDIAYQRNKTLTIPAGVTIKNYGKIVVGGTIASTGGSYGGVCAGAHSNIQLDGTIEMTGANCILSAVGYIVGNGQIVTFEGTGAQLYQPFTICDFRGGSYTVTAAGNDFAGAKVETNESLISPFIRYTARSIQVQTVIAYGSTMTGYCDLYANDNHNMTKTLLIGSGGLINLGAGSKAVCSYDANTYVAPYPAIGKTTIEISGGGSFGYLTLGLKVPLFGTQEIKTNALIFPVPYNFDIRLTEGRYTLGYSMALLPGAGLHVARDASLNVGSSASDFRFLVLDGLYDHTKGATETGPATVTYGTQPGLNYPTTGLLKANTFGGTGTADLVVAGTLNIQKGVNFGGVVQAGDTGVLNMDAAAKNSASMQIGLEGKHSILTNTYYLAGATTRTLNAQIIDTGTGQRLNILPGLTYHAGSGADILQNYSYHLYTTSADTSKKETHTEDLNAAIKGGWYSQMVTVHTVNSSGNELGTYQQGFAQGADISAFYTDKELTTKATTVTAAITDLYALAVASVDHEGTLTYYGLLGQAIKAAQQGDTVALLSNLTVDKPTAIAEDQSFKMDLAGNTLSGSSTLLVNNGTLTLDLNGGELSVVSTKPDNTALIGAIENAGTLSVVDSSTDQSGAIRCANSQEFTIKYASTAAIAQQGEASYNQSRTSTVSSRLDQLCGIVNNGTIKAISAGTVHGAYYGIYNTGTIETMGGSAVVTSDYTALQNNGTVKMISGGKLESTGKAFFALTGNDSICRNDTVVNTGAIGTITESEFVASSPVATRETFYVGTSSNRRYFDPNYTLFNSGGTITTISGGTFSGPSGIRNQSIRLSSPNDGTAWKNTYTGKIGTIRDAKVTCTSQYALWNGGQIGSICGSAAFKNAGTRNYSVYNSSAVYQDTYLSKRVYPTKGRTDTYSTDDYPTIDKITDSVEISATACNYALQNEGKINTIDGNVTISAKNYALRVVNGGVIGKITGNAVISATVGERGISIEGARTAEVKLLYNDDKRTQLTQQITTYGEPSRIGTITGNVTISAKGNFGIINYGTIDTISGNVQIKAATYGVSNQAADGAYSTYTITYGTNVRTYDYMRNIAGAGHIGTIGPAGSDVRITVTGSTAVRNYGSIALIGSGTTLTAKDSTLYNADNRETRRVYRDTANDNKNGSYDTKREYLYVYGAIPEIETINGATITASNDSAVLNSGVITTIQGVKAEAKRYTIYNHNNGAMTGDRERARYYRSTTAQKQWPTETEWLFKEVDTSGIQYVIAQIGTIENCEITSRGGIAVRNGGKIGTISGNTIQATGSSAIYNVEASRSASTRIAAIEGTIGGTWTATLPKDTVTAYGALPEIGTIDANTITSTSGNAIDNRGIITTLGADGLSVTANAGHAVYSADSLKLDSYATESKTYAGQSCTVVTEITKSTAATTTTPAEIHTLTTGQYSASGNGTYALYNNGSNAISVTAETLSPYSGPQFKSASSARAYAVYGPDNAAKQTYVSNGDQGTPVTLSAKADGDGWFYLVANTATVVFEGGEGTTENEELRNQLVDLSVSNATVNCPTFTKNQHEFLGFAVKADATEADFAVNESGALSIAVSALKSKTSAVAGDTITLYAVYKQSYLHTVDWKVTGADVAIEQTKIMTADETVTKSVANLNLTGKYIIKSCTISPEGGANQTVTLPADNINLTNITSDITVTLELAAYDHIVTIKAGGSSETHYVAKDLDVLTGKSIGYTVNGRKLITEATGNACNINVNGAKTAVTVTNITADTTVTVTLVDYQYKVVVQDAGGAVLQTQYVSVSGENVTDVLDSSKLVGYTAGEKQLIKEATGEKCNVELNAAKTEVEVTSINGDATVTVTLVAYDHIVTVNATGYSQTYYVKNNGNVLANNAPITYTATGKNVISSVTILPDAAEETHDATTATITNITDNVIVTVALESYDYLVTIEDGGSPEMHYVKGDKDVLTNAAITYTAGDKKVITGITGGGATFERGEGDVNTHVSDGWKSFTLSGINADQTVAVTLTSYDWTVDWTLVKQDHGITANEVSRSYVENGAAAALSMNGFRATGVTGAGSATVDTSQNGVVTISNITANLAVTVTARNYSYAVTWNVNGTQAKTDYLAFDANTANYTAGTNMVITEVSVTPAEKATVTHTNTKVTVTGISSDVTVHVTTATPTTELATYYFGDMSYEYKRNTVLYQWDGKSKDKGQWIPVDSFAWQHKAGSRIYEFEDENLEAIVVPNGSVLLVNGSNQTMQYTVTYADGYEGAAMTFTAGEKTGSNILSVVLKPGEKIMVSSTFACDVTDKTLTNAPAGQVAVTTEPYNG